ncbi:hypothetical protein K437DRAFT_254491 [Tilletiaria anomala UBC 951]|uniref:GOLD domain-containing protein n=1 Tax=Tilletiaria anomala (strain ATCC 24038 / CBS 436.72 / UBC 951) TaxID=1037660 RepID=A0A066WEV8_TILAU|nr:uncharacterized protein K437DRAFT_254491 [Tilletiaria anomala UBC 951]KDN52291.1 hypothetical protein K437DRAFT_254491 [Tilletiaria anomala UBC 951]
MRVFSGVLLLLASLQAAQAVYFYMESGGKKCFIEELPNDTVVVGHYMAEEWDQQESKFVMHEDLGIKIAIKEMTTEHVLTSSRGPSEGKFAFTSHESGDHQICLTTDYTESHRRSQGQVRMHLDIIIGDAKPDNTGRNKQHVESLAERVRDLNAKVHDIKKEQQFQREREALFRDLSEKTNTRAIYWSAIQMFVLLGTCIWQLRHLRVFFEDKKLR